MENRAVIEFRDQSWWEVVDKIEDMGIVFCSVDAPELPRTRIVTNNRLYLRIHGYKNFYKVRGQKTDCWYNVKKLLDANVWTCDCKDFLYGLSKEADMRCKHIIGVQTLQKTFETESNSKTQNMP